MIQGGRLCGAVRYSIVGEPVFQLYCYCTDCRRVSGTDGYAAYVVQRSDLTLEQGEPTGLVLPPNPVEPTLETFVASAAVGFGPI